MNKYLPSSKEIAILKEEAVPYLFSSHQIDLIEKKVRGSPLRASEKVEYSRSISKKLHVLSHLQNNKKEFYCYGEDKMIPTRKKLAVTYLKRFNRRFKGKQIIMSGSFLYKEKFNDIDLFVVSKYEKDDFTEGKFHISYLLPSVYSSLLFASISQLCISNQKIDLQELVRNVTLDTFIALYQELCSDIDKHPQSLKTTLREFLLQAAFLSRRPIPDSRELHETVNILLHLNTQRFINSLFIQIVLLHAPISNTFKTMQEMILSYEDLIKQYPAHTVYYSNMIETFNEVIKIGKSRI